MNTQTLIDRLLQLPQEITQEQIEILTLSQEVQNISTEMVKCEARLKTSITAAVDEGGKKLYSNEDARRAALIEMLDTDLDFTELSDKKKSAEHSLQMKKIRFDELIHEQKNIRAILVFLSGQDK